MRPCFSWKQHFAMAALFAGLLGVAPDSRAQGIHVAITPAHAMVLPGQQFQLDVTVTQAGSAFNGFDVYIGFDPAALTFIQAVPLSQQIGSLMTSACGNFFHDFHKTADSLKCTVVMLCPLTSVTGPGQVYRLTFKASTLEQTTAVRFLSGLQFYSNGLYVNPDSSTDGLVQIGTPSGVGDAEQLAAASVVVASNPARDHAEFRVRPRGAGAQSLEVWSAAGRRVRHLQGGIFDGSKRIVAWDGRDDSGARLPSGIYIVGLKSAGASAWARVVLVH